MRVHFVHKYNALELLNAMDFIVLSTSGFNMRCDKHIICLYAYEFMNINLDMRMCVKRAALPNDQMIKP